MKIDRKDELLLLIAVSGEIPSDWVGRAVGSESYAAALLTRLKREGEVKLRSKDGVRGYLLRNKAKQYLLVHYGEDVRLYLSGANSTNHVKSEPEKRLRLHRMSMVWIYFHHAGIRIFQSEKTELFPVFHQAPFSTPDIKGSAPVSYYGTMEWKQATDMEIKGSRACGVLAAERFYVVYNMLDSLMKWVPKTERNVRSRLEVRLRKNRGCITISAIMMGTDMAIVRRILTSMGGLKGNLFSLDDVYECYYYIPFLEEAVIQLRLLCSEAGQVRLYQFLCKALKQVNDNCFTPEAGADENGNLVYFCYMMDLWQVKRIMSLPLRRGGRVFCFTYQAGVLQSILPECFKVEAIRPEKVYRYLGWKK